MKKILHRWPLAFGFALASCASLSPAPSGKAPAPATTIKLEQPDIVPTRVPAIATLPAPNVWDQLRGSFAMGDCDADPQIMRWARYYTHDPIRFENQLRDVLPQLVYVQQVASHYRVAGEFVLLPWVESQFQAVPGRKRRPAGMWQIMPVTAGAMGLRVDGGYDGRLDVSATADAVMKLLQSYHEQLHDWRLTDYAYNAGESSIRNLVQKRGLPAESAAIPAWPVRSVTRQHLAKLLAMACVVRDPARFEVSLPLLPGEQHLVQVKVERPMPVAQAASHAGLDVAVLKNLNAAYRNDKVGGTQSYLLLPADNARQLRDALLNQPIGHPSSAGLAAVPAAAVATTKRRRTARAIAAQSKRTHTVRRGESLWQIARQYAVNVGQLQRWNHLRGGALKPGAVLKVSEDN